MITFGRNKGFDAMRAKGRLKAGEMNDLEKEFHAYLQCELNAARILWYGFELIKLRIADGVFLELDFFIMLPDGELQGIDVKGRHVTDDARAKMKVAASMFPFRVFVATKRLKRDGGGWEIKEVGRG